MAHWEEEEGIVFADKILERTGYVIDSQMLSFIPDNKTKAPLYYQSLNDYRSRTNQEFENLLMSWRGMSLSQAALYMLLNKGYLFISDIRQNLAELCEEFKSHKFEHFAQELQDCFETKLSPKRNLIVFGAHRIEALKEIKTAEALEEFLNKQSDSDEEMQKLARFLKKYQEHAHCKELCKDVFDLKMSSKTYFCVRRKKVRDLGDIAYMTEEEALNIHDMNEEIMEDLRSLLETYGLSFSKYE